MSRLEEREPHNRIVAIIFRAPVTKLVLLLWIANYLQFFLTRSRLITLLTFYPSLSPLNVVTAFLYPLAIGDDLYILLISAVLFFAFGRRLEHEWGSWRFLGFLLLANLAALVGWELGLRLIIHRVNVLYGPWLLLASVAAAWAWQFADQRIAFLPRRGLAWLAILLVIIVFPLSEINFGPLSLLLGLFSLGGVGMAALFAHARIAVKLPS